eukprot:COSAG02_NODE_29726_length_564_cov_0.881720_1_plen_133_part_01
MGRGTAAELAAARAELALLLEAGADSRAAAGAHPTQSCEWQPPVSSTYRMLTDAGKGWAEAAGHDMKQRAQRGSGGSANRTASLAAELERARRELAALGSIVPPHTMPMHTVSSSDRGPAGQISIDAVTSAQR